MDKKAVKNYFISLQNEISTALKSVDNKEFFVDKWDRPEGGGGESRIFADGDLIEKGGVNFSHVLGETMPSAATAKRPELLGASWEAMGVSLVIHPENPHVPTAHMNVRFFSAKKESSETWWFGGGYDLTPYYGYVDDCNHWHSTAKKVCDEFSEDLYKKLKKNCDDYFFLPHRDEPRGIGGIFFDDFDELGFENSFKFTRSLGSSFLDAYMPIVKRRKNTVYGDSERNFQLYRRGRYVEFNLLCDRGTLFGLQSMGRTESILMSMPPLVKWEYDWKPSEGSKEKDLYDFYLKPKNWVEQ